MHLVQILLPLRDNEGAPFPGDDFTRVRAELVERFGGVTAHLQAPAQGVWKDEEEGKVERAAGGILLFGAAHTRDPAVPGSTVRPRPNRRRISGLPSTSPVTCSGAAYSGVSTRPPRSVRVEASPPAVSCSSRSAAVAPRRAPAKDAAAVPQTRATRSATEVARMPR